MRSWILFLTLALALAFECPLPEGDLCCPQSCGICNNCTGDNINDEACCGNNIINNGVYCYMTNHPPCILGDAPTTIEATTIEATTVEATNTTGNSSHRNDLQIVSRWVRGLEIYQLVLFILGIVSLIMCLLYVCCCFGNRKPPLRYVDIVDRYGKKK